MKLNINKQLMKKGIFIAGLSLTCLTTNACSRSINDSNIEVSNMKEAPSTNDEKYLQSLIAPSKIKSADKLSIALEKDTQNILKAYNDFFSKRPFPRKVTLDDIEYLSNLTEIKSIKLEDGSYTQFGDNYSIIYDEDKNVQLTTTSYTENRFDILTGKKMPEHLIIADKDKVNVREFLDENDINFSAYTFPIKISWSDKAKEKIIEKYGEEMFMCIKEYGLPLKMYEAEVFNIKANVKTKKGK